MNCFAGVPEVDDHEPQIFTRSNTWPRRQRPTNEETNSPNVPAPSLEKNNYCHRNPWGSLSYADLITQAIESSPENRLTLSQIYDWMIENVPYFKDKRGSNSSIGWKNSIRHNLSLHTKFVKVQNEERGKSSWWMINPGTSPVKYNRRRSSSLSTANPEKKRGKIKKTIDILKKLLPGKKGNPNSSMCDNLATIPENSYDGFRPRSFSNVNSREQNSFNNYFPRQPLQNRVGYANFKNAYSYSLCPIHNVQYCVCHHGTQTYITSESFHNQYVSGSSEQHRSENGIYTNELCINMSQLCTNQNFMYNNQYSSNNSLNSGNNIYTNHGNTCDHHLPECPCLEQMQTIYTEAVTPPDTSPSSVADSYTDIQYNYQNYANLDSNCSHTYQFVKLLPEQSEDIKNHFISQPSSTAKVGSSLDELNGDSLPKDFACNIDEVVTYELNVEGNLDFN